MADEAEVAYRTDEIAKAMARARSTLESVGTQLGQTEFHRVLDRRLEDVAELGASVATLREAEGESRAAREPDQMIEADARVRRSFATAQQTSGQLAGRIGNAQRDLAELDGELADSADLLDRGLRHLDALEQLPGRQTIESANLRAGLENLKGATDNARGGIQQAVERLGVARTAAGQLEVAQLPVDGSGRHSAAVMTTAANVSNEIVGARDGLHRLREQMYRAEPDLRQMAQHGIDVANSAAAAAHQSATAGRQPNPALTNAGQQADPELANAARAGLTPRPVDPRIAYALGAQDRRPETGGPSKDKGIGR
jgi:chromosome segregation ATPase